MAGDDFTRRRLDWLDAVAADGELLPLAFKLAFVISGHVNRKSGFAWPSQATLATAIGASDRTVRTLCDMLVRRGHLHIKSGRGRHTVSEYRLADNRKPTSALGDGFNRKPASSLDDEITGSTVPRLSTKKRKHTSGQSAGKAEVQRTKSGSTLPAKAEAHFLQNPLNEPIEEPVESLSVEKSLFGDDLKATKKVRSKPAKKELVEAFERWWKTYPKKTGKIGAQKLFVKTVTDKLATIEELIAGAEQCAREYAGERRRYAKDPQKWLRNGHWHDEPDAPHHHQPYQHTNGGNRPMTGIASAIAGVMSAPDDDEDFQ